MDQTAEKINKRPSVKPFLKWAGGKTKLLESVLVPRLPADYVERRHVEPFVGGGSLFFRMAPEKSFLSDINDRLIRTYREVRDDVETVIQHLQAYEEQHNKDLFYETRSHFNEEKLDGAVFAAAFIYLNKTCFNGLYRENSGGGFNVPIGSYKNPNICDMNVLRKANLALQGATLTCCSFEEAVLMCVSSDFVYFDSPYEPVSNTSNFKAYHSSGFDWTDQNLLFDAFVECSEIGCKVMLSNSDVPELRDLYKDFKVDIISAPRSVGGDRQNVSEILVRNY